METKKSGKLGADAYELTIDRLNTMKSCIVNLKHDNNNPNSDRMRALLQSVELCRDIIKTLHYATEIMVLTADKIDKSEHGVDFVLQAVNARRESFTTHKAWEKEADELIDMVFTYIQAGK